MPLHLHLTDENLITCLLLVAKVAGKYSIHSGWLDAHQKCKLLLLIKGN